MQAKRVKSGDDCLQVIKQYGNILRTMDDYWVLEQSLLRSLVGSSAEARISAEILAGLPHATKETPLLVCLQRLEAMAAGKAMKLSPEGLQAGARFICKHLQLLSMGVALSAKIDNCSQLVKAALARFQFFLSEPHPDIKGEKLRGCAAFEVIFARSSAAHKEGKEVPAPDVDQLECYIWLAAPGAEAAVAELVKALQTAADGKAPKKAKGAESAASCSGSGAAGSSTDKKAKKADAGKMAALKYFD